MRNSITLSQTEMNHPTLKDTPTKEGNIGDRRGDVIWHTQGSGKSLSMVFYISDLEEFPDKERTLLKFPTPESRKLLNSASH